MHRGFRGDRVTGAPLREKSKRAGELPALGGQLISGAGRSLGVGPRYEQRIPLESFQALRQDARGDPGDVFQGARSRVADSRSLMD